MLLDGGMRSRYRNIVSSLIAQPRLLINRAPAGYCGGALQKRAYALLS
jgi:hypothetical protein